MNITKLIRNEEKIDFNKRVDEIQKKERCSRTLAMQKARGEFPNEFDAYQKEGAILARPIEKREAQPDAVRKYNMLVAELGAKIRKENPKVKNTTILREAQKQFSQEFRAYQDS